MKTPTSAVMVISPKQARLWLEKNTMNRPINEGNLSFLTSEIQRNNFHITGESIKIAEDGTLLDGQHRLMAIVKSGMAVKMFVIQGLPKDSFKYMDTGRTRQASDVLAIEGIKNSSKMAALAKFVMSFSKNKFDNVYNKHDQKRSKITNADVSDFVNKNHESLLDSYEYGFGHKKKLISGGYIAGLHYIFKKINRAQADAFINDIVVGENLSKSSPAFILREKFITDSRNKRKMSNVEKLALVCKAWNLYRQNKTVVSLRWDKAKDQFPKPI